MSATFVATQSGTLEELRRAKKKLKGLLQQSEPAGREQLRQQLHALEEQLGIRYREEAAWIQGNGIGS